MAVIVRGMTTPLSCAPPPSPPTPGSDPSGDRPGDRSRAGAVWVTATGAFLLFAAAAVFVAVQWHQIPNEVRLGILSALTGSFLLAGRRLRPVLPATGGILYHLGAFLIPVNVAALALHLEVPWESFVLVEGATATAAWFGLNQIEHSKVLAWASTASVVVTAGGLAAVTGWPAALLVAGAALAAEATGRHRPAVIWAAVAGLAPALALAEHALPLGTDVLATLGLAGSAPRIAALASGMICAAILGRNARRREDLPLAALAAVAAGLGLLTGWVALTPGPAFDIVGGAMVFVLVELVAAYARRDAFWARPGHVLAVGAEALAGAVTGLALALTGAELAYRAWSHDAATTSAPMLVAAALAAAGWYLADLRRRTDDGSGMAFGLLLGGGWPPATIGFAVSIVGGTAAGASPTCAAMAAVVVAAALVLAGRPLAHSTAAALVVVAPCLAAIDAPSGVSGATGASGAVVHIAIGLAGALVLAWAAVIRSRMRRADAGPAWFLAATALVPIALTWSILATATPAIITPFALALATIVQAWLVAIVLHRGEGAPGTRGLAFVGRGAAVAVLATAASLRPGDVAALATVLSALAIADALRLRTPWPMVTLPITLPIMVATAVRAAGGTIPQTGLALCVLAAVAAGVSMLLDGEWAMSVLGIMVAAAVGGMALTSSDLAAASTALIILGGIGLAYSAAYRSIEGSVFGWLFVTAGYWGHLQAAQIVVLDAYLAPVALALLAAGLQARRPQDAADPKASRRPILVSSWVAFGPAIVLLGGSALLERIHGGGGIHALVAGAVGVAAVLAGGGRRLVAPLLLGTALLVALTAHESLGVTRDVPTWAWLALGGSILLGAGITMERLDRDPLETGRRLVDVVHERFT